MAVVVPGQLSEAVAAPKETADAEHWPASALTVTLAGQVIEGAWLSRTVTVCAQVAVLPEASVAVQITVVTPTE